MDKRSMTDAVFEAFFAQRSAAAEAFVGGDPGPIEALLPKQGDVSFHGPRGDSLSGAEAVASRFREESSAFLPGGASHFEVIQKISGDDLAFWTGMQVTTVRRAGQSEPTQLRIRVTEAFRRIDGEWKLIHRHADVPQKT